MTTEQELEIIKKKNDGVKLSVIMEEYSIKTPKTIYDIIKRNGIKKIGNKKYNVDENYFSIIDNEYKAYWLGFLYADGYVRMKYNRSGELKLKLSSKDKEHILLFNKCISSNYPIKDSVSTILYKGQKSNSNVSTVSIYNTKIVNDLIKIGCVSKKTFVIRLPKIENSLYRHFIRGYFDGDGCLSESNKGHFTIKIISNEHFIEDIKNYLLSIGLNKIYIKTNGKVKSLLIYNIKDCLTFKNFIYDNSSIYLERKYKIFEKISNNS